ncbi:TetR/AcrR family transcriptional regulator [Sanguibacter sp. 4.1]|uniref:TetR/AcrR family transcriptional regulator n=1 Tax=Sanguibacter biliveldensis TaxID=3030830 RepID=A0AAF0ZC50_9MICO|nr:TetR/AcrR family transcriptional regulator [Sanguibacter sp. 4.1]WPF83953.1 TetR/AcrR family transcriptional regulator [Sanguibacter sp. 4.1]
MRTSKKTLILDAATRVVQDSGVTAVTFDSVAAEAGLTRGGIMYHFPSRDDLLAALHEHQAQAWDEAMTRSAGKTAEEATDDERLAAYVRVCADTATRAELQLLLEGVSTPEYMSPWTVVMDRWTPPIEPDAIDPTDQETVSRLVARLAADGLWMHEALSNQPLPPAVRTAIVELIAQPFSHQQEPA